jgi:hypothetical protein
MISARWPAAPPPKPPANAARLPSGNANLRIGALIPVESADSFIRIPPPAPAQHSSTLFYPCLGLSVANPSFVRFNPFTFIKLQTLCHSQKRQPPSFQLNTNSFAKTPGVGYQVSRSRHCSRVAISAYSHPFVFNTLQNPFFTTPFVSHPYKTPGSIPQLSTVDCEPSRNSFIYRFYDDSRSNSFTYRIYASRPGVGCSVKPQRTPRLFTLSLVGRVILFPGLLSTFNCRLSTFLQEAHETLR